VELGPLLRAHSYLRVEQPPDPWSVDGDDERIIRMLGEMIVAALVQGTELGDVVLRANNVTVAEDGATLPLGDYVALTIEGAGDWSPEVSWVPADAEAPVLIGTDLDAAARAAGVRWAYTRAFDGTGSITVLLPRARS
jgi:hypothetical protein